MEVSTVPDTRGGGVAAEEYRMKLGGEVEGIAQYSGGRNRWSPQETLALFTIRSEIVASSTDLRCSADIWRRISRRMNKLGYARSAQKCKEKFENTHKYHKRTKGMHQNGKSYKFFQQLEAIDSHKIQASVDSVDQTSLDAIDATPCSVGMRFLDSISTSTTSTTPSQEEEEEEEEESEGTEKKKRKLVEFFDGLMASVIKKQENLQSKFVETVERFERDRMARDEAWKLKELDRIKRERELLAQEREVVAAKDAAVLSLLEKLSNQSGPFERQPLQEKLSNQSGPPERQPVEEKLSNQSGPLEIQPVQEKQLTIPVPVPVPKLQMSNTCVVGPRWLKEEIKALINVRTDSELRYQGKGSKGPLWDEVSVEMRRLGYDRNAKRCKEKWENMNKYFKRVKDGRTNKERNADSKTCPYFNQLDALYSRNKRMKLDYCSGNSGGSELRPEELLMHMMQRRQEEQQHPESATTDDGDGYRIAGTAMTEQSPETDDGRGSYFCSS
ncbi:Trihelix transcription factor GT-2 [Linum grandiflorum]